MAMASAPDIQVEPPRSGLRIVPPPGKDPAADDAALVGALRAGDPGAPGRLWDRHSSLVRRILRRVLGPVDVEDAVQDSFARFFRDLSSLRDPSALRSFLIGIAFHVAKSELRRRRARRWVSLSDDGVVVEPEALAMDSRHEARAAVLRLYRLLDRISDERRAVFVLRFIEGLELAELSEVLGCSLATTKRRVADAAKRVSVLAASDPLLAPYMQVQP
jgi:RNA polymerase sigma-70 factor (ECF subfamily)